MVRRAPSFAALALTVAVATVHVTARAVQPPVGQPVTRSTILGRLARPDERPLLTYRARRHLEAVTRGGRMRAELDAWTTLEDGRFTFEVIAESGSSLIRHRVLWAALDAEQRSQTAAIRDQAALTEANYEFFALNATPDRRLKLDVKPRRRHVMLVEGALYFDEESADLVRIEGELSKRPSFWTRRVHIVREYQRIDGVHVPVAMHSTADVLVSGESTFSMTYDYAEINGRSLAH